MITKYDNYYVVEDGNKKIYMPQSSSVFINDGGATVVRNTASRKNVAFVKDEEDAL